MKYETRHKDAKIVIKPAEDTDWRGKEGYEAQVTPKGCKTATSFNNYENATQALSFAKESIDNNEIPQERKKVFGIF